MKTKHTPGPWHVVQYACYSSIQSGPMYGDTDLLNSDLCNEAEANGQLAAAAPELLEALQHIVSMNGVGYKNMEVFARDLQPLITDAKQAIQKATS